MGSLHKITLVLLFCLVASGRAEYLKYKDPKQPVAVRVKDLLSRMTLAEKIGQMTQIERENATADVLAKYFIGSVLSGGGSVPAPQASAEQWASMVNGMQKGALSTRLGIPIIYGIDAVHGHNNVYKATIFPHNVGLGATRDPELVKKIGEATALEVRATGIPYVFAPCVAVCRDPRWGRCYESYSEDPKVVQSLTSLISGLQGDAPANSVGRPYVAGSKNVAACAKHYVGDGGTYMGINENNTIINTHGLLSIHMPPYYNSIIRGVSTVMVSYSSWNGVKMHANHFLVTDFLKNKLKFRGFVISDWEGIDRITSPPHANYSYSIEAGIGAGIDMIMVPFRYTEFIDDLTSQVQNKVIPMSRIDDAVYRILRVKFTMGLFENPYADPSLAGELGKQEHRELAREAVRKSLVLLKNGKSSYTPLLPLPKKAGKILIAGSHADNLGNQCGGWTITWQGESGNNLTAGTTILSGIKATVDPSTQVVYSENPDSGVLGDKYDYAIVVVGEPPYAETFGDNLNLTIPAPGPSVIQSVCKAAKCVVVLISGRPLVVEPYLGDMDAFVAAWLPGTEGQGVADVLFGADVSAAAYLYATSEASFPGGIMVFSLSREAWSKESDWIGYVAVSTDAAAAAATGRRVIYVAWRGTIRTLEWVDVLKPELVAPDAILPEGDPGRDDHARVMKGWYLIYTSSDERSPFSRYSPRDQLLAVVRELVARYKGESLSIVCTGHSLGASLATLCAFDMAVNGVSSKAGGGAGDDITVTAIVYGIPQIGNPEFKKRFDELPNLRALHVRNEPDVIPLYPSGLLGYANVGDLLAVDSKKSPYVKHDSTNVGDYHNLQGILHTVAGWNGKDGEFKLQVHRSVALVNKSSAFLKDDNLVPESLWVERNKGIVIGETALWQLEPVRNKPRLSVLLACVVSSRAHRVCVDVCS